MTETINLEEYEKELENTISKYKTYLTQIDVDLKKKENQNDEKISTSLYKENEQLKKEINDLVNENQMLKQELRNITEKYNTLNDSSKVFDEKIQNIFQLISDNDSEVKKNYLAEINALKEEKNQTEHFLQNKILLMSQFGISEDLSKTKYEQIDFFIEKLITDNKNLIESNENYQKYIGEFTQHADLIEAKNQELEKQIIKLKEDISYLEHQRDTKIQYIVDEKDKEIQKLQTQYENTIQILKVEKENAIKILKEENEKLESALMNKTNKNMKLIEGNDNYRVNENIKEPLTYNYQEFPNPKKRFKEKIKQNINLNKIEFSNDVDHDERNIQAKNSLNTLKSKLEMLESMLKDSSVDTPIRTTEENI